MPRIHRIVRIGSCVAALGAALWAGAPAGASDFLDPLNGQLQFQLQGLQRQSVTDPAGAASGAAAVRRDMISRRGGVALSPADQRIDRQLQQVQGAGATTGVAPLAGSPPVTQSRLPSSFDRSDQELPSMGDPLGTTSLLLDRAADGLAAGRTAQARSDLSVAAGLLDPLRSGPLDGTTRARADALAGRLATLTAKLPANP